MQSQGLFKDSVLTDSSFNKQTVEMTKGDKT